MHKTGFYSINAETGKEVWAFPIGYDYYAKPCAINNTIYVGANGNQFFAIDAATGLYEWTFKSKDSIFTRFTASPCCMLATVDLPLPTYFMPLIVKLEILHGLLDHHLMVIPQFIMTSCHPRVSIIM